MYKLETADRQELEAEGSLVCTGARCSATPCSGQNLPYLF